MDKLRTSEDHLRKSSKNNEPPPSLQSYINPLTALVYRIGEAQRISRHLPMDDSSPSLDKRHLSMRDLNTARKILLPVVPESLSAHEGTIARMNNLVKILNTCQDMLTFKRAYNALIEIICEGNTRFRSDIFKGEEYSPDKLDIEAAVRALPHSQENIS